MDLSQKLLENSGFRHSFNAFHMRSPDKLTNLPEAFLLFESAGFSKLKENNNISG